MKFLQNHLRTVDKGVVFYFYWYKKSSKIFVYEGVEIPATVGKLQVVLDTKKEIKEDNSLWIPIVIPNGELVGVLYIKYLDKLKKGRIEIIRSFIPFIGVYMDLKMNCDKIDQAFVNTITVLSDAIDTRDYITSGHSKRVADYSRYTGIIMGLKTDKLKILNLAATVHDIGKIGIPESILFKAGKLNRYEFDIIKQHTTIGDKIISKINLYDEYLALPSIVRSHHERIDGSGYPDGLKGEDIPLESRIIAVCDVFDALTNTRPYRSEMNFGEAKSVIYQEDNKLDKDVIESFMAVPDNILESVYRSYRI
jgi:HD-GYP domain-containing protein (c-di-GMP phosphodiesterase class II)